MNHRASRRFWDCYQRLPVTVQRLADASFAFLRQDPRRPSLLVRKVGPFGSVRVGLHDRALAVEDGADLLWFRIGTHAEYDRITGQS